MFLDVTSRRNPGLIRAAAALHRRAIIPANTYVLDLDALTENVRLISSAAEAAGIKLYAMLKQLNRNQEVARAVAAAGIGAAVAVDPEEATKLATAGIRIGHVGHLVQPTAAQLPDLLALRPEVMTVFSAEKARQVSAAASRLGMVQDVMLRVAGPADFFHAGQEGGIEEEDLLPAAAAISTLPGVRLVGVTSFPCIAFDGNTNQPRPTANLSTLTRAAATLRAAGYEITQINAPSQTCCATLDLLRTAGATHGEPGHGLTGTTPWHAVTDLAERPAVVYLTEVSHTFRGHVLTVGGGLYPRSHALSALVGPDPGRLRRLRVLDAREYHINYYGVLDQGGGPPPESGESVIYALRMQMFVARANLALVTGLSQGHIDSVRLFNRCNDELAVPHLAGGVSL